MSSLLNNTTLLRCVF